MVNGDHLHRILSTSNLHPPSSAATSGFIMISRFSVDMLRMSVLTSKGADHKDQKLNSETDITYSSHHILHTTDIIQQPSCDDIQQFRVDSVPVRESVNDMVTGKRVSRKSGSNHPYCFTKLLGLSVET